MAINVSRLEEKIRKATERNAVELQRNLVLEISAKTAIDTPVDSGKATANWQTSVNTPMLNDLMKFDPSLAAGETISRQKAGLSGLKPHQDAYLANAVTGVGRAENGAQYYRGVTDKYIGDIEGENNMFQKNVNQAKNIVKRLSL